MTHLLAVQPLAPTDRAGGSAVVPPLIKNLDAGVLLLMETVTPKDLLLCLLLPEHANYNYIKNGTFYNLF